MHTVALFEDTRGSISKYYAGRGGKGDGGKVGEWTGIVYALGLLFGGTVRNRVDG